MINKKQVREIATKITNAQLKQMFDNAKVGIKNWTKVSICNKGCTIGTAWNILAKDFKIDYNYHILAKTNMVREFGKYLPDDIKPPKKENKTLKPLVHYNPIF